MYPTIKTPTCQTSFTKPSHTNQPSNTATMPQPSPSPQETQPFSQSSSTATMASTRNSALPPSHPAQRRWLIPHLQTTGNSAFLPAIQRSADGSSNSRESTQSSSPHQSPLPPVAPHPHHYLPPGTEQPGRRVPVGYDSAGGELILGWRKSALFLKSPLSERQQAASSDFLKTVLAEFRQPRSQPPTKPGANRHPSPRRPSSAIRHPPSTTKKERPAAHPDHKERSPNSISLQSYTITCDQHTIIPYDRIKYNS